MIAAALLASLAVAAPPPRAAFDATRVLIRDADRSRAHELGAVIDDDGLAAPGWCTVRRPEADLRAELLSDPSISFAAPVIVHLDGRLAAPVSRIIVRLHPGLDHATAAGLLALEGAGEILAPDAFGLSSAFLIETGLRDGAEVIGLADRLAMHPAVRFAEPEWFFHGLPDDIPNDPLFPIAWGLHSVGQVLSGVSCNQSIAAVDADLDAPEAWDLASGDPSVLVVVIDNGMQFDHPDLLADPALGADFTGQDGGGWPVHACDNHGTAVAGCVAAIRGNAIGTTGIAAGVRLASLRISTVSPTCNTWTVNTAWVASALEWSVAAGARITNTSWTFLESTVVADAYASAAAQGLLHFASAGNNGAGSVNFPSSLPSVVAVGALAPNGGLASFSNRGVDLEFVAPGSQIVCPDRTGAPGYGSGDYLCLSGTSFASPAVAGTAALMLSVNPSLDAAQVRTLLKTATVDLGAAGWDPVFGWGLPKAPRAVRIAGRPADLDGDGDVDAADLAALLSLWGSAGPAGDLSGDGVVGAADITVLLGGFGRQ